MISIPYEIVVQGNNLRLRDDFLGLSNVTLLRPPSGPMLVDTGGYVSRLGLISSLRKRGLTTGDIKTVFLTHLHFDHAHNIDLFPEARFIVSRREWDYAANPDPKDILMPWRIHEQLEQCNLELIDSEGEIEPGLAYFPAPGHTPGCYALTFIEPGGKRVVVAGDAIKYVKEAILARCDMAFDTIEAGTASIQRILAMADRIVPGHFPELIKQENGAFSWDNEASLDLLIR